MSVLELSLGPMVLIFSCIRIANIFVVYITSYVSTQGRVDGRGATPEFVNPIYMFSFGLAIPILASRRKRGPSSLDGFRKPCSSTLRKKKETFTAFRPHSACRIGEPTPIVGSMRSEEPNSCCFSRSIRQRFIF